MTKKLWKTTNHHRPINSNHLHQVSIQLEQAGNTFAHFCGGSIIGHHWIVTAAHCINIYMEVLPELFNVLVGDHNRAHVDGSEQALDIDLIIKHESFNASSIDNDIALIKTKQKITFNQYVQPVCVPGANFSYPAGKAAFISGWGSTEKVIPDLGNALRKKKQPRDSPNVLQAAKVPLVNTTDCNAEDHYKGEKNLTTFTIDGTKHMKNSARNRNELKKNPIRQCYHFPHHLNAF